MSTLLVETGSELGELKTKLDRIPSRIAAGAIFVTFVVVLAQLATQFIPAIPG